MHSFGLRSFGQIQQLLPAIRMPLSHPLSYVSDSVRQVDASFHQVARGLVLPFTILVTILFLNVLSVYYIFPLP